MYQVTFIIRGKLHTVNTPDEKAARSVKFALWCTGVKARMWQFVVKRQPVLTM
jgi:hypothetical protein